MGEGMATTTAADPKEHFLQQFEPFDRTAPAKYQPLRQAARGRFRALSWPNARTEDWRFTNVAPLLREAFELAGPATVDAGHLPPPPAADALRLVFVNGRFAANRSRLENVPAGVVISSLAQAPEGACRWLGRVAAYEDQVFTALNTAFAGDGAYLAVPDGQALDRPVEVIHLAHPGGRPSAAYPRTLVTLGKGARATVVERFLPAEGGTYFTNAVSECVLGEGATLDHVKLQQEAPEAFHIAATQFVLAGRARLVTHALALGGRLSRNDTHVRFDGEHAEATVNGLYLGSGRQHVDNQTVIDHARPNCASHELYKGILDGHAHGVFNGKIFVRKDAQKTDAKQTNKVLLLSDDATIDTKPQLEIFADDVKCTHGATVGQLDAEQLFYLRSRGLDAATAQALLTFAFANDVVGRIPVAALRAELERRIVAR